MRQQLQSIKRLIPADYLTRGSSAQARCSSPGCRIPTREGKPYCVEHITEMTQVKDILARLRLRQEEYETVNANNYQKLTRRSILIQEAVGLLFASGFTERKLAETLMLEPEVSHLVAIRLGELGLAKIDKTKRGHLRVSPLHYQGNGTES